MAAQELGAGEGLARQIDDFAFGAAGVGDQGSGAEQRVEVADGIEDAADGLREENEVCFRDGGCERSAAIDGARGDGIRDGMRGTDSGDGAGEAGFAQRQSEGGADQTGADDDYVLHVRAPARGRDRRSRRG